MEQNRTDLPRRPSGRIRLVLFGVGLLMIGGLIALGVPQPERSRAAAPPQSSAIMVQSAVADTADVPVYLTGLGTVQAFYTVTVSPRVDGQLTKIAFTEGQTVKQGDLLAQIDPRPYQATLDQAIATRDKDAAQLANAQHDLERYITLAPENFTSKQVLDTQKALVSQLTAQAKGDQAAIDLAKTQLDYATITSPINGRTGIRQVDPGNNLHAANNTGIVVVTQVQPISLIFTLPEDDLADLNDALSVGKVPVVALSRDGKTKLSEGELLLIDNQIDQATGTIRLKATFANTDNHLWPGEFVNAQALVGTKHGVLTVPSAAIQRGPNGVFAYVVTPDSTVESRPLKIAEDTNGVTIVTGGLQAGDRVTTNNEYRLQPGIKVKLADTAGTNQPSAGQAADAGAARP
jgi:multidrug efflux system membrane fusion protein